jgi:prefoldin subunit 5
MDLLQKDFPSLTKIYEAKCFYDSQNNRIILYYKNHVTARTLVDYYNLETTPPPNSSLYVIYDLQTGTFNVSTDPPTYTVSNSKVYVTSPINAEYDMDKVIIYRISLYETSTSADLNDILAHLNTIDTDLDQIRTRLNTIDTNLNDILTQLSTIDTDTNLNDILTHLNTIDTDLNDIHTRLNTIDTDLNDIRTRLNTIDTNIPIFSPLSVPYSRLYIQSTAPTSPQLYDSWYNTITDELSYWNGSAWIKVDWTKWVQNDIWYRLGKLRINTGKLEISNDNTNWYQVFPVLGRTVEVIADDTNTADNFKIAYLTVGQTLLVRWKNLARAAAVTPSLWIGNCYHTYPGDNWFGIIPSNITISNGYGQYVLGYGTTVSTNYTFNRNFVPIIKQANESLNWVHFSMQIVNTTMTTTAIGHGYLGVGVTANIGAGAFTSNAYFLGSFCYEGAKITVYSAITRQG